MSVFIVALECLFTNWRVLRA